MRNLGIALSALFVTFVACKSTEGMSGRSGRAIETTQGPTGTPSPSTETPSTQTPPASDTSGVLTPPANFKVAYLGDQGLGSKPEAVLNLIKSEGANLYVVAGDFDYDDDPDAWDAMLQKTLGDLPMLAAMGNHDEDAWSGYEAKIKARLAKMPKAKCEGEVGVKQKCEYEGILFALTAMGMSGSGHAQFIDETFTNTPALFKVCVWHYNQTLMQVGDKDDQAGWEGYETCRKHGAMIITAHEHSYSRTHLMSGLEKQTIADTTNNLALEPGKSFVTVTGLGGKSIRGQSRSDAWWAKIYTSDQGAKNGAVFCTYNIDGNPRKAKCVFKNVAGEVVDDYTVESKLHP